METVLNNIIKSSGKVCIIKDALEPRSLIFIENSQYVYIPERKLALDRVIVKPGNEKSKQEGEGDGRKIETEIEKRLNTYRKRLNSQHSFCLKRLGAKGDLSEML